MLRTFLFPIAGVGLVILGVLISVPVIRTAFRDVRSATREELAQVFPDLASLPGQYEDVQRASDGRFWLFWVKQTESEQEQSAQQIRAHWLAGTGQETYVQKYGPPKYSGNGHSELRVRRLPGGSLCGVHIDSQDAGAGRWDLFEALARQRAGFPVK